MNGRRRISVATEGIPFLLAMAVVTVGTWQFGGLGLATVPFAVLVWLYLIFHDPQRGVPSVPLGVVSPVDGRVVEVPQRGKGMLEDEAQKVVLRVNSLGTYTARCPVEGKIMDLHGLPQARSRAEQGGGLWLLTDEGENVVLQFHGNRLRLAPRAFLRYGERVGQGQRCAYLRLTKFAEIELPANARIQVTAGQRVTAGEDVLAKFAPP